MNDDDFFAKQQGQCKSAHEISMNVVAIGDEGVKFSIWKVKSSAAFEVFLEVDCLKFQVSRHLPWFTSHTQKQYFISPFSAIVDQISWNKFSS